MAKTTKIFSAFFLFVTIGLIIYLSVGLKDENQYKINLISLEGNSHLSKEQYMNFANLLDKSVYGKLSLQIIKDRIEKHPYVQRADVRYDGSGKVSIKIVERIFDAILLDSSGQYILTENLQLLPVLPGTKKIDYPVISNPLLGGGLKVLLSMKKINDIVIASKIISAVKLLNPELEKDFSSIDLQNGGDVVLFFSSLNYPVIVGRGNEIRKVSYFNSLWNYLKGKEINNYLEYVDLRYGGHVYLGITEPSTEEGQKKS